ncbi:PE domain-containing protein [Mycobacteroides abscessus subsp. abscessus]|uniref:PE domain-containing protein n=1 Tax=Mycolicibacterium farcinogenes TaxID=1802 RepID=A0ACD1FR10_MYCFR|nr:MULTISPECIES: PE domain-containing protein [Mycolicibacterium]MDO3240967.1 PE domain-containing protein [Mycobacteroides abscessus subsp. abscessus]QZH69477.1 PE domain-containing protein [Mycolicibacterium farcinogenes]
MFLVDAPMLAAQGATEAVGAATTGAVVTGAAPAMLVPIPMGGEEVSLLFAQAIAAHAAQFDAAAGVGVMQRAMFAASSTAASVAHVATDVTAAAQLAL